MAWKRTFQLLAKAFAIAISVSAIAVMTLNFSGICWKKMSFSNENSRIEKVIDEAFSRYRLQKYIDKYSFIENVKIRRTYDQDSVVGSLVGLKIYGYNIELEEFDAYVYVDSCSKSKGVYSIFNR